MHLKISTLIRVALRPELNTKKQTQTCKIWHFWNDLRIYFITFASKEVIYCTVKLYETIKERRVLLV